jgi:hypothetical protein
MKTTYGAIEKRFEKFLAKYTESQRDEVKRVVLDLLLAAKEKDGNEDLGSERT